MNFLKKISCIIIIFNLLLTSNTYSAGINTGIEEAGDNLDSVLDYITAELDQISCETQGIVNVLIRDEENKWSSSNARKLLKFSSKQGFYDITWELGNEPNSLKVVKFHRVFFNLVSSRKKNEKNE